MIYDHFIRLEAETEKLPEIVSSLSGPELPWFPEESLIPEILHRATTAHEIVALEMIRKQARNAYAALPGYPDWYEVSLGDILKWKDDQTLSTSIKIQVSPISFPKRRPLSGREEMEMWKMDIPGFEEAAYSVKGLQFIRSWAEEKAVSEGISKRDLRASSVGPLRADPFALIGGALLPFTARMIWVAKPSKTFEVEGWWFDGVRSHRIDPRSHSLEVELEEFIGDKFERLDERSLTESLLADGVPKSLAENLVPR